MNAEQVGFDPVSDTNNNLHKNIQTIAKMRMLRYVCDVSLGDNVPSVELRDRIAIELVTEVGNRKWLR